MASTQTAETVTAAPVRRRRIRPTDRQVFELSKLTTQELVEKALAAMFSLNRRAKEKRDRRRKFRRQQFADAIQKEIERIYELKNRFLDALVRSERASVEEFSTSRRTGWLCPYCGREWWGQSDECFSCGGEGEPMYEHETWYIVQCSHYRWHQPGDSASEAIKRAAKPGDAHDPNQEAAEIPKVGLTIEAQHKSIEMAIEKLSVFL